MSIVHSALKKAEVEREKRVEPFRLSVDEILTLAGQGIPFKASQADAARKKYFRVILRAGSVALVGMAILFIIFFMVRGIALHSKGGRSKTFVPAAAAPSQSEIPQNEASGQNLLSQEDPVVKISSPSFSLRPFSKYRLTGILTVRGTWAAMINDRVVEVGDTIDGAKVLTIQKGIVILDKNGETLQLRLN